MPQTTKDSCLPRGRAEGSSCHTYGFSLKEMHLLLQFYGNVGVSLNVDCAVQIACLPSGAGLLSPSDCSSPDHQGSCSQVSSGEPKGNEHAHGSAFSIPVRNPALY